MYHFFIVYVCTKSSATLPLSFLCDKSGNETRCVQSSLALQSGGQTQTNPYTELLKINQTFRKSLVPFTNTTITIKILSSVRLAKGCTSYSFWVIHSKILYQKVETTGRLYRPSKVKDAEILPSSTNMLWVHKKKILTIFMTQTIMNIIITSGMLRALCGASSAKLNG